MDYVIRANTFLEKRALKVDSAGVHFLKTSFMGGKEFFPFSRIDCVLMSAGNVLSFQVGMEVFSIPTKPKKRRHQEAIAALLDGVKRSAGPRGRVAAPPVA